MIEKMVKSNNVYMRGRLIGNFMHNHSIYGKELFDNEIEIPRFSRIVDILPVTIPENIMQADRDYKNKYVHIIGELRSYNIPDGISRRRKLKLIVFAREIGIADSVTCDNRNEIFLEGYLCKKPVYRITPFKKEITDFILAVNRVSKKSDYLPCICWSENARKMSDACVGDHVRLAGRLQSRIYEKNIDGKPDFKRVYEVSAKEIEVF